MVNPEPSETPRHSDRTEGDRDACQLGQTTLVTRLRRIEGAFEAVEITSDSHVLVRIADNHRARPGDYALVTIEKRRDEIDAWEARLVDDSIVEAVERSGQFDFDAEQCLSLHAFKPLLNSRSLWVGKSDCGADFLMLGARGQFKAGLSYRLQRLRQTNVACSIAAQEPLLSNFASNQIVFDVRIAQTRVPRDGRLRGYNVEISDGVFAFLALRMAPAEFAPVEGALINIVVLERREFDAPEIVHFDRLKHRYPLVFDELERRAEQPNAQGVSAMVALHFSGHAPSGSEALFFSTEFSTVPANAMGCYLECLVAYSKETPQLHEPLVAFLQSNAPESQKGLAATALARMAHMDGTKQSIAFFRRQLRGGDVLARCDAVVTLLSIQQPTTDEIHTIIAEAINSGSDADLPLVRALATRGVNALPDVVLMASSDGRCVRQRSVDLLNEIAKRYDANSPDAVNQIIQVAIQLCDHHDVEVRLGAVKALRTTRSGMSIGGNDFRHAQATSNILNQIATLCESLFRGEPSYRVRRELVWAMPNEAEFKHVPGDANRKIAFLQQGVGDESYSVRIQSQSCLCKLGRAPEELTNSLGYPLSQSRPTSVSIEDLGSTFLELRARCFTTLVEGEAAHLDQLSRALRSDDRKIVLTALEAIAEIGDAAQLIASELFALTIRADDLTVLQKIETTLQSVYRHAGLP